MATEAKKVDTDTIGGRQLELLRGMHKSVPAADFEAFVMQCNRTRLDPFSRQIYLINRGGRWSAEVSIDGARLIAQRTGEYRGQTQQEWCGDDGVWKDVWVSDKPPAAARLGVFRAGHEMATYAVANFRAYRPQGRSPMWDKMSETMISKCAESLALRKCFPAELSGLYTAEEMEQVQVPAPRSVVRDDTDDDVVGGMRKCITVDDLMSYAATIKDKVGDDMKDKAKAMYRECYERLAASAQTVSTRRTDEIKGRLMGEGT